VGVLFVVKGGTTTSLPLLVPSDHTVTHPPEGDALHFPARNPTGSIAPPTSRIQTPSQHAPLLFHTLNFNGRGSSTFYTQWGNPVVHDGESEKFSRHRLKSCKGISQLEETKDAMTWCLYGHGMICRDVSVMGALRKEAWRSTRQLETLSSVSLLQAAGRDSDVKSFENGKMEHTAHVAVLIAQCMGTAQRLACISQARLCSFLSMYVNASLLPELYPTGMHQPHQGAYFLA
jgi:hypothetical protein